MFITGLVSLTLGLAIIVMFTFVGVGFIDIELGLALLGPLLAEVLPFDTVAFPIACGSLALLFILYAYGQWVKEEEEWGCATRLTVVGLFLLFLYSGWVTGWYFMLKMGNAYNLLGVGNVNWPVWIPWVFGPIYCLIVLGISSFIDTEITEFIKVLGEFLTRGDRTWSGKKIITGCLVIGCIVCIFMALLYWWIPGWVIFWIGLAIILAIFAVVGSRRE